MDPGIFVTCACCHHHLLSTFARWLLSPLSGCSCRCVIVTVRMAGTCTYLYDDDRYLTSGTWCEVLVWQMSGIWCQVWWMSGTSTCVMVSGTWCQADTWCQVLVWWCQVLNVRYLCDDVRYLMPGTCVMVSGNWCQVLVWWCQILDVRYLCDGVRYLCDDVR